jgi:hypothetical protein
MVAPCAARVQPEELDLEVGKCRQEFQNRLGQSITTFAYP